MGLPGPPERPPAAAVLHTCSGPSLVAGLASVLYRWGRDMAVEEQQALVNVGEVAHGFLRGHAGVAA